MFYKKEALANSTMIYLVRVIDSAFFRVGEAIVLVKHHSPDVDGSSWFGKEAVQRNRQVVEGSNRCVGEAERRPRDELENVERGRKIEIHFEGAASGRNW